MRSTFHGLEVGKRAMFTQQSALYTMGHNIANVNTPGYTRQRINFIQSEPYPPASMNRPEIPGQMGTGVQAGSIQRIRVAFLDLKFRDHNTQFGYYKSRTDALSQMEDILNEPTDGKGLAAVMNEFWKSFEDISTNPTNDGARKVAIERANAIAETFHYLRSSLEKVKGDLGKEINYVVGNGTSDDKGEINSILESIQQLNKQIAEVEPHGDLPNDLYDARDKLVDELSEYLDIEVKKESNGGHALKIAEGDYKIYLKGVTDTNGDPILLVDKNGFNQVSIEPGQASGPITDVKVGGTSIYEVTADGINMPAGKLKGLIESFGYIDSNGNEAGSYPKMVDDLDKMAYSFLTLFNEVHAEGYPLPQDDPNAPPAEVNFFDPLTDYKGAAAKIKVNPNFKSNHIRASTEEGKAGDGIHAINLANVQHAIFGNGKSFTLEGFDPPKTISTAGYPDGMENTTVMTFYSGKIGVLGVEAKQAKRQAGNALSSTISADEDRQSVSAVQTDEEFIDMIRFQHAYNAAARTITVVDEMLDRIINGMGIVGR